MKNYTTILLICLATTLSAQEMKNGKEVLVPSNLKHEIGLAAGFSTGYGLSYRYWPSKYGVQVTCSPVVSENVTDLSIGVTGLADLRSYNHYRFFLYLGNSYRYNEQTDTYTSYMGYSDYYETTTVTTISKDYTIGFGPGMEFLLGERVGFNIMFGYMARVNENKDWFLSPTVETGLYFRF